MPESRGKGDIVLGFDFGTQRIGVAVGSDVSGRAQALTTLHRQEFPDWDELTRIVAEWRPRALVVGLPLGEDGTEQPITERARAFSAQLAAYFNLPVYEADERFSSTEAVARLRAGRAYGSRKRRLQKGDTDAMAAQVILETFLAQAHD